MTLEAETTVSRRRPFRAAGSGGDREFPVAVPVLLATEEKDRPVDEVIWGDEKRMKRELVAWAKAVASMVAGSGNNTTSSLAIRHRRGCP